MKKTKRKIKKALKAIKPGKKKPLKKIAKVAAKKIVKAKKKVMPAKPLKKLKRVVNSAAGRRHQIIKLEDLFPMTAEPRIFLTSSETNVPPPQPQVPTPLPEPDPTPEPPMPPVNLVRAEAPKSHMFHSVAVPKFAASRKPALISKGFKHDLMVYSLVGLCALFIGGVWLKIASGYMDTEHPNQANTETFMAIGEGIKEIDELRQEIVSQVKEKLSNLEVMILGQETIKKAYAEEVLKTMNKAE